MRPLPLFFSKLSCNRQCLNQRYFSSAFNKPVGKQDSSSNNNEKEVKIRIVSVKDILPQIQSRLAQRSLTCQHEKPENSVRQCTSSKPLKLSQNISHKSTNIKIGALPSIQNYREYSSSSKSNPFLKDVYGKEQEARFNELQIQMLSKNLHSQLFKNASCNAPEKNILEESIKHLKKHKVWGKTTPILEDVDMNLPKLSGNSLDDHFRTIAEEQVRPYKSLLNDLICNNLPPTPSKFVFREGWTKYNKDGSTEIVSAPDCSALVFDVEVCVTEGSSPTLATAASKDHWYSWCSRQLVKQEDEDRDDYFEECFSIKFDSKIRTLDVDDLIPLRNSSSDCKVIIGHNVSYDRLRVKEEYFLKEGNTKFIDTMSMHIAVSGFIQEQRAFAMKNSAADRKIHLPWMSVGSLNNLDAVYQHYCKGKLNKDTRKIFVKGSMNDIRNDFQNLMKYCASDVIATHEVLVNLLPVFYERISHPVSFAGMLEMGSSYLTVNKNWARYVESAESEYNAMKQLLNGKLILQVHEALTLTKDEKYLQDPWLWSLEWSIPSKFKRQAQYIPEWYYKLCKGTGSDGVPDIESMSTGLRAVPKLLKLTWKGYPLHYVKGEGWGYLRPTYSSYDRVQEDLEEMAERDHTIKLFPVEHFYQNFPPGPNSDKDGPLLDDEFEQLFYGTMPDVTSPNKATCSENSPIDINIPGVEFIRLPHKNGPGYNVGNPLAKDFLTKIEDGTLSSSLKDVAEIVLKSTKTIAYWRNARDRIISQNVVWLAEENLSDTCKKSEEFSISESVGAILPQVVVCGTVTRRSVEPTWLTASNARPDRIGSELKAMVTAPPGYHFVGADVDSQELWIAALLGDSFFAGIHGCTAMSWMTLQGNKADGTDVHSKTAETAKISRDQAKVINYGRIYGAGMKFLQTLLMQYNPKLSFEGAKGRAMDIIATTKGQKGYKLSVEGREAMRENCHMDISENDIFTRTHALKLLKDLKSVDPNHGFNFKSFVSSSTFWLGGSESHTFNCLEDIIRRRRPVSPVLEAAITRALEPDYVGDRHMTSRMNWVVQSSAVDYLHLMTVCMKWLAKEYDIDMRFAISIHDEVRYLVASEDRYRAALALQITNLLTRSLFAERLGMSDLPLSVAFFSSVDIDKVLRKDPHDECVSPSNRKGLEKTYGVRKGKALSIYDIMKTVHTLEK